MISYSFQPNGLWFVFEIETGKTLYKNLTRLMARDIFYGRRL